MTIIKTCSQCKVDKELYEFNKDSSSKNGVRANCKACAKIKRDANKEAIADYYEKNKEYILARNRQYYQANRESLLAHRNNYYQKNKKAVIKTNIRWRKNNRDAYNAQRRIWYANEEHREYQQLYNKKHYESNKDAAAARCNKRRAIKYSGTPIWANLEAIKKFYAEAQALTKSMGIKYEVDHIYPLQGEKICGLHCEFNLQVITQKENRSKSNKLELI